MFPRTGAPQATLLIAEQSRTFLDFARRHQLTEWWHWWLLGLVCLAVCGYVIWLYRRDTTELPQGVRGALLVLRISAFAARLLFFLDLEKRTERQLTRTSRVAVLVDTSQSMGLSDGTAGSRLNQVVDEFSRGRLLPELRDKHDVVVYRFDQTAAPQLVASFTKTLQPDETVSVAAVSTGVPALKESRILYAVTLALAVLGLLLFLAQAFAGRRLRGDEGESYLLLAGTLCVLVALVIAAVSHLRHPELSLAQVLGRAPLAGMQQGEPLPSADATGDVDPSNTASPKGSVDPHQFAWSTELMARGIETRWGEALRWVLDKERTSPLAGVIVLTDGQNTAGAAPESVIKAAVDAEISLYPVGLGSEKQPRNVRLVDLEAPARVYPGDHFNVTGYVQADGLEGRSVRLRLQQRTLDDQPTNPPVEMERRVALGADGQILPVQFELMPEQVGRHKWVLEVEASANDDLDPRDNQRSSQIEVVERRSRVLLFAGGPMRDYRFLATMLFRDPTSQVDVLLQSAPPGAAQEAAAVLVDFPADRDTLFQYDCLVAFDPDWTALSQEQLQLIDEWVAEKAGGLIVVAGPVHTPRWTRGQDDATQEQSLSIIRDLYPVTFYRSGAATIQLGRVASEQAWPLRFSDEGKRAQFLWLDDSPTESEQIWSEFSGVFGYQALRGAKPGAQVYARFSDPQAAATDELPIYMAGQFYGAGRVFYLGSGEMWRLNELGSEYFDTLYTKLIRHVSQGRLLRDSSRGILLVDNERGSLGDTISVRAVLSDLQYRPLTLDAVDASLLLPDGTRQTVTLRRMTAAERPGMYSGQLTAMQAGDYRLELAIPGIDNELLTREIKVRLPAREIEMPPRNDVALSLLAKQTGGSYFVGLEAARGERGTAPLTNQLRAKDQVTFLPGTRDLEFERSLMSWLLGIICGTLSLEWLLRRLYKLA